MEPIETMDARTCQGIEAVFTDLDDTLTRDGKLTAGAYEALWRLGEAGICVVVVTGRPAGWADLIMRLWPVAGVVGENGACIFRLDASGRAVRWYARDMETRRRDRAALDAAAREILGLVPGLKLAADQAFRETDIAIDISEEVDALDEPTLERIQAVLASKNLKYKLSSIHINAWFGEHDKAKTCRRFIREVLGASPGTGGHLFIGDSPNDEPLFEAFDLSVGVHNIERYAPRLAHPPRYVTRACGAEGFVEMADHVLSSRSRAVP